jgi:hypothetical protein
MNHKPNKKIWFLRPNWHFANGAEPFIPDISMDKRKKLHANSGGSG